MDTTRRLRHVQRELERYTGVIDRQGDSSFILCPFHSERTPSGRIFHASKTKSPGYFKCYGCGRVAKWDELAPHLGLKPIQWARPEEEFATPLRSRADEVNEEREMILEDLPAGKFWRSIPTDFLIEVGCKRGHFYYPGSDVHGKPWVWMPVFINEELRGYSRGRLRKESDKPSYINSKGGWTKDYGLFPYDFTKKLTKKKRYVVLVEGQRDALRLLLAGIPALAIMGTQNWSVCKSRMIEMLDIDFAVLMMDGDCAGLQAVKLIEPQLSPLVNTEVFSLAGRGSPYWAFRKEEEPSKAAKAAGVELWDPQNLPSAKLKELRTYLQKWSAVHGQNA